MARAVRKPIEVEASTKGFAITYGWGPVKGCHPFIGAHYFMRTPRKNSRRTIPIMSVALFPSRFEADKAFAKAVKKNPNAKVVSVKIFVKRSNEE